MPDYVIYTLVNSKVCPGASKITIAQNAIAFMTRTNCARFSHAGRNSLHVGNWSSMIGQ